MKLFETAQEISNPNRPELADVGIDTDELEELIHSLDITILNVSITNTPFIEITARLKDKAISFERACWLGVRLGVKLPLPDYTLTNITFECSEREGYYVAANIVKRR